MRITTGIVGPQQGFDIIGR